MDDREKEFTHMVEQIRNFITHCLGFQPEDMTGGEFANKFTWQKKNSKLTTIFYEGYKDSKDYFWFSLNINGNESSGEYYFNDHLYCEDEEEIVKIIQPFKDSIENRKTLNVTTKIEQSSYFKWYYIIQAFKDCYWQDVLFSRGDISTAEKKARHYRNQNDCETRVIAVKENATYSYEYELVTKYAKKGRSF